MAFDDDEARNRPAHTRNPNSMIGVRDTSARRAQVANHRIAGITLVTASLATFVAATFPGPLVLSTLSSLLMLAAGTAACIAFLFGQKLFAPHLSLWDKATALVALGLVVSLEVDGAATQAFLDAQSSASVLGG